MKVPLHNKKPSEPGKYLYQGASGMLSLITVVLFPEEYYGGVRFEPYLGVVEFGRREIGKLNGKFSEKIEICAD